MLTVGLTGSIAVGKSYVAALLKELGCFVLDADQTAREVVAPHTLGWQQIIENFGREILNSDETINRAKLATIVFSDEPQRQLLNQIVHPLVIAAQNEWIAVLAAQDSKAIAVIEAALMIESGGYRRFDKVIVVWCDAETQLQRLITRNSLDKDVAAQRIAAQMPREEKKKYADFLIDTSGGFAETQKHVETVYQNLVELNG